MYARAIDDARARLHSLRCEGWEDLGLAAFALLLAVAATQLRPALALPLFVGGLAVGARGVRAVWRRWDLIERLAAESDAYVITEVREYALQQATLEKRRSFAALIRSRLPQSGIADETPLGTVADELGALASELDNETLVLDPAAAVSCARLLTDLDESPLLNPALPAADLRARIRRIRAGFEPRLEGGRDRAAREPAWQRVRLQ
jgi:hypothetical protein